MVLCPALGILRCNDAATQKNVVRTQDWRRPKVPRVFTLGSGTHPKTFAKGLKRGLRRKDGASFK
jgi:hypothetical protein